MRKNSLLGPVATLMVLWLCGIAHSQDVVDPEADRIVRREMAQIKSSNDAGSLNRVRQHFIEAREKSDYPEAYQCLLGMLSPKNSAQAYEFISRACSKNSDFALARLAFSQSLRWRNAQTADRMLEEAYALAPGDPDIIRAWGEKHLAAGDLQNVREAADPLLQSGQPETNLAIGAYLEGRVAAAQGKFDRAQEMYATSLRYLPHDAEIRAWAVRAAVDRGQFSEAANLVQQSGEDSFAQAQASVALADAIDRQARRELFPQKDAAPVNVAEWRDGFANAYDAIRLQLPYNIAPDSSRLAQWNDIARGKYAHAWQRFEERLPIGLTLMNPTDSATRFQALKQATEGVGQGGLLSRELTLLAEAMEKAGWTAEALEVARQVAYQPNADPASATLFNRLTAHQGYLQNLSQLIARDGEKSAGALPLPERSAHGAEEGSLRHPSSALTSKNAAIATLRDHNQYLLWNNDSFEEKSYRLMMILMEDQGYVVGSGKNLARVNVVVGEDIIPPAGAAAGMLAGRDRKLKDHCYVSVAFEPLLHDLFIQQADAEARMRLEAQFQAGQPWDHYLFVNDDDFSPDTLAVVGQKLFSAEGLGAAASGTQVDWSQLKGLRQKAIESLADYLAKREAFRLAIDQKTMKISGNKDLKTRAYALANCSWPGMAFYEAYHQALAGEKADRDFVKALMRRAQKEGIIRDDQPPLLQAYWLTEQQIKALALSLYEQ